MRKLKRDKVVSIVKGQQLVGVYWADTDGSEILFECSPEKADKISTVGAAMIEKYSTYFAQGDDSIKTKLRLTIKFLKQNGIEIKKKQNTNELSMTAVH